MIFQTCDELIRLKSFCKLTGDERMGSNLVEPIRIENFLCTSFNKNWFSKRGTDQILIYTIHCCKKISS